MNWIRQFAFAFLFQHNQNNCVHSTFDAYNKTILVNEGTISNVNLIIIYNNKSHLLHIFSRNVRSVRQRIYKEEDENKTHDSS